MKKFLCAALAFIALFSLPACAEQDCPNESVGIEELYANIEGASFAKLNLSSVDGDIYYLSTVADSQYLIVECNVEEDYYGRLDGGTIYVPVSLDNARDGFLDAAAVTQFLQQCDCFFVYLRAADGHTQYVNSRTAEIFETETRFYGCPLWSMDIIPVVDSAVDFTELYELIDMESYGYYHYLYPRYTDYIDSGMSLEQAAENIKSLAVAAATN